MNLIWLIQYYSELVQIKTRNADLVRARVQRGWCSNLLILVITKYDYICVYIMNVFNNHEKVRALNIHDEQKGPNFFQITSLLLLEKHSL